LTEAQNGFGKRKCIDTAIQSFIESIQETLDTGLHTIGILFDLTKAYNVWNHKILLEELYSCGIRGNMNLRFQSYSANRWQFIDINHCDARNIRVNR